MNERASSVICFVKEHLLKRSVQKVFCYEWQNGKKKMKKKEKHFCASNMCLEFLATLPNWSIGKRIKKNENCEYSKCRNSLQ